MSVEVKLPSFDNVADQIIATSEKVLEKHAIEVRNYMRRFAPYGFGELRGSFKVTDLFQKGDNLQVRIESDQKYAKEMDEEMRVHMKFRGDNPSGQRSFSELGERGQGRQARYWSGLARALSTGDYDVYASDYTGKAIKATGGPDGVLKKLDEAIKKVLGG